MKTFNDGHSNFCSDLRSIHPIHVLRKFSRISDLKFLLSPILSSYHSGMALFNINIHMMSDAQGASLIHSSGRKSNSIPCSSSRHSKRGSRNTLVASFQILLYCRSLYQVLIAPSEIRSSNLQLSRKKRAYGRMIGNEVPMF